MKSIVGKQLVGKRRLRTGRKVQHLNVTQDRRKCAKSRATGISTLRAGRKRELAWGSFCSRWKQRAKNALREKKEKNRWQGGKKGVAKRSTLQGKGARRKYGEQRVKLGAGKGIRFMIREGTVES